MNNIKELNIDKTIFILFLILGMSLLYPKPKRPAFVKPALIQNPTQYRTNAITNTNNYRSNNIINTNK